MSRIGKLPIALPSGVQVSIDGQHISVKGPKGTLQMDILPACSVIQEADQLIVALVDQEHKNMR